MKARTAIFIAKCRGREEILLGTESTIGVNGRIAFSLTRCDANGMAALKPLPDLQRLKLNLNHPNCFARELYQLYRPFEYKPSTSVPYLKKCGRLKAPVFEPGDESDASGLNRMKNVTATGKESGWWYYNVGVSEIKQGITSWLLAACQRDKKEA